MGDIILPTNAVRAIDLLKWQAKATKVKTITNNIILLTISVILFICITSFIIFLTSLGFSILLLKMYNGPFSKACFALLTFLPNMLE